MDQQEIDVLMLKDEIVKAFRPIEHLFKIMDTSSVELYGKQTEYYSEVGAALCQDFRRKIDVILTLPKEGDRDGQR